MWPLMMREIRFGSQEWLIYSAPLLADRTVDRPVFVESEEIIELARVRSPFGLAAADALADVLNDLAIFGNVLACIDAPSVYFGRGQTQLERAVLGVNRWFLGHEGNAAVTRSSED